VLSAFSRRVFEMLKYTPAVMINFARDFPDKWFPHYLHDASSSNEGYLLRLGFLTFAQAPLAMSPC